ncbi:MAG: hypothetical protein AAF800_02705 [Planctomycetota bacterium]
MRSPTGVWRVPLLVVALWGPAAAAQDTQDTPDTPKAPEVSGVPGAEARRLVSDMLLRRAIATLRDQRTPDVELRDDQQVRADVLLDLAVQLSPDDAELWERKVNLAEQAGDTAGAIAALRRVVDLRPDADARRLRLTLAELAEIDTLDGRLAVLEQRLNELPEGDADGPLRSRLASAAATLARELGDQPAFLKHLKTAVRSDPANGEAAALTWQLARERDASPRNRAAAAINLVRARPLDSDARLILGRALADVAAFEPAAEQFEVAARLPRVGPVPPDYWAAWSGSLIASGRPDDAAALIDRIEAGVTRADAQGNPVGELPIELDLHRRVLHGETEEGTAAYERVTESLRAAIDAGRPGAELDLAWVMAMFGPDTEAVTDLLAGQDRSDPRYLRATGFVYMREGAETWARRSFEAVADDDDVAAYGLALLQGRDDAGRARFVRQVMHDRPGTFGGLLAASQLQEMRRDVMPGREGRAVIDAMNRLPSALWRLDTDRAPWTNVRAEFALTRTPYLLPIRVDLVIQNLLNLPIPLDASVGHGTTGLIGVSAFAAGRPVGDVPPVVVDLGGRLTLGPRERWAVPVRLDRSIFGLFAATQAPSTLTYNATFVTAPRFLPNGAFVAGPLGATDNVRSLQTFAPNYRPDTLGQMADRAASEDERDRFVALAELTRFAPNLRQEGIDSALARRCVEALIGAYDRGDAAQQAWIVLMLPPEPGEPALRTLLEQAQRSGSPLVQVAYLQTHATDADDAALAAMARDGGPAVRRFAEAQAAFLRLPPPPPEAALE